MDSRFGVKDFLLFALVIAVGAAVILAMVQEDRRWSEVRALRQSIDAQTKLLADIEKRLAPRAESPPAMQQAPVADSWAVPGVPVTRPPAWTRASDPRAQPGFAVGGTMTEIFEGRPPTLTPYLANDVFSYRIVNEAVCESLAALDSRTLELRGLLAEAWQEDPQGRWLRVRIRDEARFSDGEPVTAEDVRFTFAEYVMNQAINAGPFRGDFARIESVAVISDKAVEFRFKEPRFNNLRTVLRNAVLPAHYYRRFTPEDINASTALVLGSGPWRLESADPAAQWKPPAEITLVRNERYWGEPPPIDRLRFTIVPDNGARLKEFEEGKGDLMRSTPEQHAAKAKDPAFLRSASALAWTSMRSGYTILAWNTGQRHGRATPFADPRIRRAMTMVLDRERINRDFYEGLSEIATGPFPAWQGDPAIRPHPFDPEGARSLLAQAGWSDRNADGIAENESGEPFTWELTYVRGSVVGERVSPYIIDQCARIGVRVTTRIVDASALAQIRASGDFDCIPTQWSWSDPEYDPYQTLHSSQIEGGDNWIRWANPEADALIDQARATIDPAARAELWRRLHRLIHEQQPCTYLLNVPWMRFVSSRVGNVHPYPVGLDKREMFIIGGSAGQ